MTNHPFAPPGALSLPQVHPGAPSPIGSSKAHSPASDERTLPAGLPVPPPDRPRATLPPGSSPLRNDTEATWRPKSETAGWRRAPATPTPPPRSAALLAYAANSRLRAVGLDGVASDALGKCLHAAGGMGANRTRTLLARHVPTRP